ncbi:hypothetical protein JB92DRAFT_3004338 [Gautieria morchelliformis]|nr:hypothetical protein JB92DRAFT_3004338 [Gautieria morchelliformis]
MGNRDPNVQFNPDNRVFWASHTGLPALDDKELDATYQRAHKFLTDRVKTLIKENKWRELDHGSKQVFLSLSADGYINRLSIPKTVFAFLDPSLFADWRVQFEMGAFEAKRPGPSDNDLFISGPVVLSDIFYILQSIAPGMLVIADRIGESDDMGEMELVRALPRESWVTENDSMLKYILGDSDAFQALLDASRDQDKSFTVSWVSPWDDDDSDCRSTGSYITDEWDDTEYKWPWRPRIFDPVAWTPSCGSESAECTSQCDL